MENGRSRPFFFFGEIQRKYFVPPSPLRHPERLQSRRILRAVPPARRIRSRRNSLLTPDRDLPDIAAALHNGTPDTGEIVNPLRRAVLVGTIFCLIVTFTLSSASAQTSQLKTRNVVLIVSDGLRWQEIFTGADPTLMDSEHGGIWGGPENLKRKFWRDEVSQRREVLFPFCGA